MNYFLNHDNEVAEWDISYLSWFEFNTGDYILFRGRRRFEQLNEIFDFRDGVEIPIGSYYANTYSIRLSSNDSRLIGGDS